MKKKTSVILVSHDGTTKLYPFTTSDSILDGDSEVPKYYVYGGASFIQKEDAGRTYVYMERPCPDYLKGPARNGSW